MHYVINNYNNSAQLIQHEEYDISAQMIMNCTDKQFILLVILVKTLLEA